jgi:ABC-type uncharacterized transport system substrate-binding protein
MMALIRGWLALFLLLLAGPVALAQEMPVPADLQAGLLLKLLPFDRALKERAGAEIVVVVVYQPRFRLSSEAKSVFIRTLKRDAAGHINGLPLRLVELPLDESTDFAAALQRTAADVVYLAPLRAVDIAALARAARQARVLSFTGVPEYVTQGAMVGVAERRNRPSLVINLGAARAAGVDLRSELLNIAQIVGN